MIEIDSLALVRTLRAASGYSPPCDDDAALARRISEDPGSLAAVAEQIRFEASLVVASAAVPDHSQCGEFNILLRALISRAASPGIVVDVGACDRTGSNSYDLITSFGWRGILIEAYPTRAAKLHEEFAGGKFEVVECAIGLAPGREKLWLGAGDLVNSLDQSVADLFGGRGESVEVDVRRLADVLSDANVPHEFDVLSIDIEGVDIEVFNDLIETSPYRPRYAIVEAPHGMTIPLQDIGFGASVLRDYRELERTLPNVIFERLDDGPSSKIRAPERPSFLRRLLDQSL